jgi:hypothetical protein
MLMDLLTLIGRGGVQRPADLAAELGVSGSLLEGMLADLVRMGYLGLVESACSPAACSHCASSCSVSAGQNGRTWALTDKGMRVLQKTSDV